MGIVIKGTVKNSVSAFGIGAKEISQRVRREIQYWGSYRGTVEIEDVVVAYHKVGSMVLAEMGTREVW